MRLETLRLAGELKLPFTTGLLIGIGETRRERIDALRQIRDLHQRYGHIQEVIIQNFRAKPGTRMAGVADAPREELLWTIAVARLLLGASMNIQAPPNLSGDDCGELIDAGINDWGGVSPVTPDHVNPEAPWPAVEKLAAITQSRGKLLVARLPSYPAYCLDCAALACARYCDGCRARNRCGRLCARRRVVAGTCGGTGTAAAPRPRDQRRG